MSQNLRNQPGENGVSERTRDDSHYHKEDGGFEGMNYEQPRQPYPSRERGNHAPGKQNNNGNDHCSEER